MHLFPPLTKRRRGHRRRDVPYQSARLITSTELKTGLHTGSHQSASTKFFPFLHVLRNVDASVNRFSRF
jgi:hypothetical protein